jgi:hypothetical protein
MSSTISIGRVSRVLGAVLMFVAAIAVVMTFIACPVPPTANFMAFSAALDVVIGVLYVVELVCEPVVLLKVERRLPIGSTKVLVTLIRKRVSGEICRNESRARRSVGGLREGGE